MAFANTKTLLKKAQKGKYAIGHFNINNMEITQGIVQGAVKAKAPLLLATSEGALKYAGIQTLFNIAQTTANKASIPIAYHLDHGRDLDVIKKCIKIGYSSVMFDGSHLPYKENLKITKRLATLAHKKGVHLEAELGTIGGTEDTITAKNIIYTDPEQTKEFTQVTGCDFLAIAIGTSHGAYKFKGKAHLDIARLKQIKKVTKVPLVLHGASAVPRKLVNQAQKYGANLKNVKGVPESQLKQAIKNGICKVNTDTDLRIAFDAGIRKFLKTKPKDFDPRHILKPARELVAKTVELRIKTLGSANKK